jgi:hypothetical protein
MAVIFIDYRLSTIEKYNGKLFQLVENKGTFISVSIKEITLG